jgi:hypothetical protein
MDNGPISVSAPGKSLIGAQAKDITFSTRYPFTKLDSTNSVSYRIISIFFNTEPPDAPTPTSGTTSITTLIYSYPHGYKYVPSNWFLLSLDNFASVYGTENSNIAIGGAIPGSAGARFYITVDNTNVNFYIYKWRSYFGTPDAPVHIIGMTVSVKTYIFVEDLLGNSVPSHA